MQKEPAANSARLALSCTLWPATDDNNFLTSSFNFMVIVLVKSVHPHSYSICHLVTQINTFSSEAEYYILLEIISFFFLVEHCPDMNLQKKLYWPFVTW